MDEKILEVRNDFNRIIGFVTGEAVGQKIHIVELSIFRDLLKLGCSLLELFTLQRDLSKFCLKFCPRSDILRNISSKFTEGGGACYHPREVTNTFTQSPNSS